MEMLLKIGFIEEIRTTSDYKKVPQNLFFQFPLSAKIDFICLTLYHWRPFRDIKNILLLKISCIINNAIFDYRFLMSQKFETLDCQRYGVKQAKSIFANKGS